MIIEYLIFLNVELSVMFIYNICIFYHNVALLTLIRPFLMNTTVKPALKEPI
jgi:hypothetical protein